jgi:hypothetical protein
VLGSCVDDFTIETYLSENLLSAMAGLNMLQIIIIPFLKKDYFNRTTDYVSMLNVCWILALSFTRHHVCNFCF